MDNEEKDFCCSHSRKSCVYFLVQSVAIGAVLIWAMMMLSIQPDDKNRDLYVSLLSTCLGIFMPQPKLMDNSKIGTMSAKIPELLEPKTAALSQIEKSASKNDN